MTEQFQWIDTDAELQAAAEEWARAPVIALDTEFVRTDTFHAYLGLIQVGIADRIWLIDPLSIQQWDAFVHILASPTIVKVLHALSEDAEVLAHHLGVELQNVFDTQIAAGFLGYPVQMSYARLVEAICAVELPKEATRSDWLQRPLDSEQCFYAAADVLWLFKVYQHLAEKLKAQERYAWVAEDSQRMVTNNRPVDPEQYYHKLRGAWKLKGERLLVLKRLCEWREKLARSSNTNRGRILQDKDLIALAEKMPVSKAILQKQIKIPSRKIRLYGDELIVMIEQAREARREDWPERIDSPLPADQAQLLKEVRSVVSEVAESLQLPAEVLARRKGLEAWLRSGARTGEYEVPEIFLGWRKDVLVEPVSHCIQSQRETMNEA